MDKEAINKDMEILLKNLLGKEEYETLKEIIESHGHLNNEDKS